MPKETGVIRILIDPVGYEAHNLGDVAMRQVAARRLRELWPDGEILMSVKDPSAWRTLIPEATLLDVQFRRAWFRPALPDRMLSRLPVHLAEGLRAVEREVRSRWPRAFARVVRLKRHLRGQTPDGAGLFLDALLTADLVFVSGVGAINDHFGDRISSVFELLALAMRRGTPTVMMGQGIGPLHEGPTAAAARRILPHVDLIGLREDTTAGPLLASFGVASKRTVKTGDDTVELAYEARVDRAGAALGLNVRVAGYVPLTPDDLERIATALKPVLAGGDVELLPIPTSRHQGEPDLDVARALARTVGARLTQESDLETPEAVIRRIGRCRLVVTGSYHAAVFALAQGIPAVCLAPNPFYAQKFVGLADLFGDGCTVVERGADGTLSEVAEAVATGWETAADYREELLESARRQVERGRLAYASILDLVREIR